MGIMVSVQNTKSTNTGLAIVFGVVGVIAFIVIVVVSLLSSGFFDYYF